MIEEKRLNEICRYWWGVADPVTRQDAENRKNERKLWWNDAAHGRGTTSFHAWCVSKQRDMLLKEHKKQGMTDMLKQYDTEISKPLNKDDYYWVPSLLGGTHIKRTGEQKT